MRDIVVQQLNDVLNAANNETNFSIRGEIKNALGSLAVTPSVELFEVLALICYTDLVEEIPSNFSPVEFLQNIGEDTLNAFLRYLNNYCGQRCGMRDGRKNCLLIVNFLK